jgi:hypothetical protein
VCSSDEPAVVCAYFLSKIPRAQNGMNRNSIQIQNMRINSSILCINIIVRV